MTDCVGRGKDRVQPAAGDSMLDRLPSYSHLEQLMSRDDPVLPPRHLT